MGHARTGGNGGRARVAALALGLLAAACPAACGAVHRAAGDQCLPSPMTASPRRVAVGERVTVSSPAFRCAARYPAGTRYRLSLLLAGRGAPEPLGTVPVARNGSFRATVAVPADAPPGAAAIAVAGSLFDDCLDNQRGSCAGYSVDLTLLPGRR